LTKATRTEKEFDLQIEIIVSSIKYTKKQDTYIEIICSKDGKSSYRGADVDDI
jgi:hypothetical protein